MVTRVEYWQLRKPAVVSDHGVVTAQHWAAAQAGGAILKAGGNAIDAAVAAAMALNPVEPWMSGMGGSGFMVVHRAADASQHAIEFQGAVPQGINPADYPLDPNAPPVLMGYPACVGNCNVVGYLSINVPGAVAGLSEAHARFGKLGWDRILAPAVDLAESGFEVDWHAMMNIAFAAAELALDAGAVAAFLPGGHPPRPGMVLLRRELAATLRRLAERGPRDFYEGETAELLVADLKSGGSAIGAEDLAAYRANVFAPMRGNHRGAVLHTAGDTSGGERLIEAFRHVAERLEPGPGIRPETYVAYADGLNAAFAARRRRRSPSAEMAPAASTTHINAIDRDGNAAALTYTLLNRFGSKVVLPSTGILMNNGLSYFDPRPGLPDSMVGGRRVMTSNMSPTIATVDGQATFTVGASGANHIVPAIFCIAGFMLDHGLDVEAAVHAPRIDASGREDVQVDLHMPADAMAALRQRFRLTVVERTVLPKQFASPSAIGRDPATGRVAGCADVYSPSAAAFAGDRD